MLKIVNVISGWYLVSLLSIISLSQSQFPQENQGVFTYLKEDSIAGKQIVKDKINQLSKKNDIEKYYFVSINNADKLHEMKSLKFNIAEKAVNMNVKRVKKIENKYNLSAENNDFGYAILTQCENGSFGIHPDRV